MVNSEQTSTVTVGLGEFSTHLVDFFSPLPGLTEPQNNNNNNVSDLKLKGVSNSSTSTTTTTALFSSLDSTGLNGVSPKGSSPPLDIVNLATEEIKRPLSSTSPKGRVPWNLAGLVAGHLQPPPPSPHAHAAGAAAAAAADPLLTHPHYGNPYSTANMHPTSAAAAAAVAAPHPHYHPLLPAPGTQHAGAGVHSAESSWPMAMSGLANHHDVVAQSPAAGAAISDYKLDAANGASMYYAHQNHGPSIAVTSHSEATTSATTSTASIVTSADPLINFHTTTMAMDSHDVMNQVLNTCFEEGSTWLDPSHHAAAAAAASQQGGLGPDAAAYHPDYLITSRPYADRKKKMLKKWAETTGATDSPVVSTAASDLFYPTSYIKDEPYPYGGGRFMYQDPASGLVHSYPGHSMVAPATPGAGGLAVDPGRGGKRKKKGQSGGGAVNASSPHVGQQQQVHGMTRDERKALALNLPITVADIINLPMDEFNDLLSKHDLSEEQLTLCRDIRRRGKNKVAARNCRKRKIDQIKQLEDDVTRIRCRKTEMVSEHEKLQGQRRQWADLVKRLHDFILKELGHDPHQWQLQMDINRQVHILPRNHAEDNDPAKMQRPYHYAPSVGTPVMEHTHVPPQS